jgi:outer membrane protein assembly factor BamA
MTRSGRHSVWSGSALPDARVCFFEIIHHVLYERVKRTIFLVWCLAALMAASAFPANAGDDHSPRIKAIQLSELRYTRPEVVLREMVSKEGAVYDPGDLDEDRERLDRLGVFSTIDIRADHEADGVILVVRLEEVYPFLPLVSLDISDEDGVSLGPGVKAVNLFGQAVFLSAATRFGGSTQVEVIARRLTFPLGPRFHDQLEYYYRRRSNTIYEFNERSHEFNYGLDYELSQSWRVGGRFSYLVMNADQEIATLSDDTRDRIPSLGAALGYDSRDSRTSTSRGWFFQFDLAQSGGFLGGAGNFTGFTFDIRRYQPLWDRHTLALFSLATLRTGTVGEDIPEYLQFSLGGTNTIRGWSLDSRRGKNQFINTFEYRYMLMKPRSIRIKGFSVYLGMQLAAFADLGAAWSDSGDFSADRFLDGYGFGIRFLVPYVEMVRIDFAFGEPGRGLGSHINIMEKAEKQRYRVR